MSPSIRGLAAIGRDVPIFRIFNSIYHPWFPTELVNHYPMFGSHWAKFHHTQKKSHRNWELWGLTFSHFWPIYRHFPQSIIMKSFVTKWSIPGCEFIGDVFVYSSGPYFVGTVSFCYFGPLVEVRRSMKKWMEDKSISDWKQVFYQVNTWLG